MKCIQYSTEVNEVTSHSALTAALRAPQLVYVNDNDEDKDNEGLEEQFLTEDEQGLENEVGQVSAQNKGALNSVYTQRLQDSELDLQLFHTMGEVINNFFDENLEDVLRTSQL